MNYMRTIKKYLMPSPAHSTQLKVSPRAAKNRLRRVFQAMKAQPVFLHGKKVKFDRMPWYLTMGTSGSGKTTLLANSKIKYLVKKKIESSQIPSTEEPDVWATTQAVFFDVPGKFIRAPKNATFASNQLWPYFLDQIEKYGDDQGLNGVIVTISLSELLDHQNRTVLIDTLESNILMLRTKFGHELPFYFVLTKCDLLPGFAEFFSDYGSNELEQAWGVPLPTDRQEKSLTNVFVARFNLLINRLNKQLISRLYQERNPEAKFFIKDFPLQLEKLKAEFADVLKLLTAKCDDLHVKGVYLTSSTQEQAMQSPAENIQTFSTSELENALVILQKPILPSQTYFVKQFLLQGLAPLKRRVKSANNQQRNLVYALIAGFILVGAYFYSKDFDHKMNKANQQLVFKSAQDGSIIISNE